jgi:hypothetical protein
VEGRGGIEPPTSRLSVGRGGVRRRPPPRVGDAMVADGGGLRSRSAARGFRPTSPPMKRCSRLYGSLDTNLEAAFPPKAFAMCKSRAAIWRSRALMESCVDRFAMTWPCGPGRHFCSSLPAANGHPVTQPELGEYALDVGLGGRPGDQQFGSRSRRLDQLTRPPHRLAIAKVRRDAPTL